MFQKVSQALPQKSMFVRARCSVTEEDFVCYYDADKQVFRDEYGSSIVFGDVESRPNDEWEETTDTFLSALVRGTPADSGDSGLVDRARVFATAAHAAVGQLRKYTNEPYIVHPTEVAEIVRSVPHTAEMLCAAYLHNVVEDTGVTVEDVWREFGCVVASYVQWLTDISKPEDGNRAERKRIDREHLRNAPAEVHTIKCADLCSNIQSIAKHDPNFAVIYLCEKRALLEVMTKADPVALKKAYNTLFEAERILHLSK